MFAILQTICLWFYKLCFEILQTMFEILQTLFEILQIMLHRIMKQPFQTDSTFWCDAMHEQDFFCIPMYITYVHILNIICIMHTSLVRTPIWTICELDVKLIKTWILLIFGHIECTIHWVYNIKLRWSSHNYPWRQILALSILITHDVMFHWALPFEDHTPPMDDFGIPTKIYVLTHSRSRQNSTVYMS